MKIADTREPQIIREKLLETGWEQQALKSGDYLIMTCEYEKVGITRKTVSDLIGSIDVKKNDMKKSLAQHLDEMIEAYPIRIILVEGSWLSVGDRVVTTRGIEHSTFQQLWNFLLTWSLQGFAVQLTSNEGHTVRRLNQLYAYFQKPYHTGGLNHSRFQDQRVFAFPSKYRSQGKKLLDMGFTLSQCATMGIEKLRSVDGIGEKGATSIFSHFHRR